MSTLDEVKRQAGSLSPEDQLALAKWLADQAAFKGPGPGGRMKWRDLRGIMPYPMVGEDAQTWVTRERRESDEARERQWRGRT